MRCIGEKKIWCAVNDALTSGTEAYQMVDDDDCFGEEDGRLVVLLEVVAEAASRVLQLVQLHAGVGLILTDALLVAGVLLPGSTLQGSATRLTGAGPRKVGNRMTLD